MVQVTEDPGVVVPSSVPGEGRVVGVGGEHGSEFKEVEEMLQPTIELVVGHLCDMPLS